MTIEKGDLLSVRYCINCYTNVEFIESSPDTFLNTGSSLLTINVLNFPLLTDHRSVMWRCLTDEGRIVYTSQSVLKQWCRFVHALRWRSIRMNDKKQ